MSSVPMPRDLSEEAVAGWIRATFYAGQSPDRWVRIARAVRALVKSERAKGRAKHRALLREKVREAVTATAFAIGLKSGETTDSIVSRVLGEEAPRG